AVVAQRGSPSSRHKGRSSRWSADRRKQKTRRMTPMFCPLPVCSDGCKLNDLIETSVQTSSFSVKKYERHVATKIT
ncbi:hypothetical protein SM763_21785, partial [Pseudophaeobacter sp. C1-32P7]